jgi:phage-related protein
MAKIDLLRKLIREELRTVIREELPKILSEAKAPITDPKRALQEQVKAKIPGTLNTSRPKPIQFSGSPMAAFLNDTAKNMLSEDFSMTTDSVHPTMAFQPKQDKVGDVKSMLTTARPSSNLATVQINEVPDFSGLMNRLKEKGAI